jgi:hypothetical protein
MKKTAFLTLFIAFVSSAIMVMETKKKKNENDNTLPNERQTY